jgi:hypothetical protein
MQKFAVRRTKKIEALRKGNMHCLQQWPEWQCLPMWDLSFEKAINAQTGQPDHCWERPCLQGGKSGLAKWFPNGGPVALQFGNVTIDVIQTTVTSATPGTAPLACTTTSLQVTTGHAYASLWQQAWFTKLVNAGGQGLQPLKFGCTESWTLTAHQPFVFVMSLFVISHDC